ncbi:hypothetical protein ACIA8K_14650 [Catenuloplanes sp. NPDC051500]|uniref:hypothetical protein n=1 Tax=Catenuloplanes sp. NPDC051500 TaxID=3363959 RepID=UPI0037A94E35
MSNPYSQGVQPGPSRPGVVTVAGYLLYVVAVAMVVQSLTSLASVGPTRDVYARAYQGTEASGLEGVLVGAMIFGAILNLLVAGGFVALAIFNNRGKNPSRITTWVIGGISICCSGFGLLGSLASGALNGIGGASSQPGMPDPEELTRQLEDAIPGWTTPVSLTASVIGLLCLIAVVVLLSLPPANDYFRKPVSAWQPPGAPGYPGYPSAYPPPSQAPYPPQPATPDPGHGGTTPPGYPTPGYPTPGYPTPGGEAGGQPGQPAGTPADYPPPGQPSTTPPGYAPQDTPQPSPSDTAPPPPPSSPSSSSPSPSSETQSSSPSETQSSSPSPSSDAQSSSSDAQRPSPEPPADPSPQPGNDSSPRS